MKASLFSLLAAAALFTSTVSFAAEGPFDRRYDDRDDRNSKDFNYGYDRNHRVTNAEKARWEAAHRNDNRRDDRNDNRHDGRDNTPFDRNQNYGYDRDHRVTASEKARWEAQQRAQREAQERAQREAQIRAQREAQERARQEAARRQYGRR